MTATHIADCLTLAYLLAMLLAALLTFRNPR